MVKQVLYKCKYYIDVKRITVLGLFTEDTVLFNMIW